MEFKDFTATEDEPVVDALKRIDANRQGFVVVVDADRKALGVLTDGDVRRGIIRGVPLEGALARDFYVRQFKSARVSEGLVAAAELFKNQSIKFLPILDDSGRLVNIITKSQLHALLLQNIRADLTYDFQSLDASVVDHEIFYRPWGFYKTTVLQDNFQSKIIHVHPGARLSLQSHERREEHWVVVYGRGEVQVERSIIQVAPGSVVFIPKGSKHRLTNTSETESLIVTEVQIGDYLGEDDIKRYEDVYGRV